VVGNSRRDGYEDEDSSIRGNERGEPQTFTIGVPNVGKKMLIRPALCDDVYEDSSMCQKGSTEVRRGDDKGRSIGKTLTVDATLEA